MRSILPIILLTCLGMPALATSYNFIGGAGGWNSSANWTPTGIPVAGDTVIIDAGDTVTVPASYAAAAQSVAMSGGGMLSIDSTGSLTINGSSGDGIKITGSGTVLTNSGTMNIGNSSAVNLRGIFVLDSASFSNQSNGVVNIDNITTYNGIEISSGNVSNAGSIKIGNTAAINQNGFYLNGGSLTNSSTGTIECNRMTNNNGIVTVSAATNITNSGSIKIGNIAAVKDNGITIAGALTNNAGAIIEIDRVTSTDGIQSSGTLTNNGTIKIGANAAIGRAGILQSGGAFTNSSLIQIDRAIFGFYSQLASTTVTNSSTGTIKIGSIAACSAPGFTNSGTIITNNGTIEVDRIPNSDALYNNGTFGNSGTIRIGAHASVRRGVIHLSGTFTNDSVGIIEINNVILYDGIYVSGGTVANSGSIKVGNLGAIAESGILLQGGNFINNSSGTVELDSIPSPSPSTHGGITTANGTFTNAGVIKLGLNTLLLNAIGNAGGSGAFINSGTINFGPNVTNGITSGMTVTNNTGGTIQTTAGGLLKIAGTLTNRATLTNNATGILTVNGTLTNSGTTTNNGTLKGTGTITQSGTFTNATSAHIAPGNSPGTLTVTGNFNLGSATLDVEVNGATSSLYDKLAISGTATLTNASLNVILDPGYTPSGSDIITFVGAGSITGNFSSVQSAGLIVHYNYPASGQVSLGTAVALPVKLNAFSAEKAGDLGNRLHWNSAIETPGSSFDVLRSPNGADFTSLGIVAGKRNNTSYTFYDATPLTAVNYYRLKITEAGGEVSYSSIAIVNNGNDYSGGLTIAPVPASRSIVVTNTDVSLNGSTATIVDMEGREAYRFVLNAATTVNISAWPAGLYCLHLPNGGAVRIVKQ